MIKKPKASWLLLRPEFMAEEEALATHQDYLRRKAAADEKEAPWRAALDGMCREDLVELAISAAYNSEHLWKRIHRLRDKTVKNRRDRQKGLQVKLANDPIQKIKPRVRELWQHHLDGRPGYRHATGAAFDRAMQKDFPVIRDPGTIEGWRRGWAKEMSSTEAIGEESANPNLVRINSGMSGVEDEGGLGFSELFWLLGYYKTK